jgi:ring-1,2-phenylacetyl-CoA epoxidase subunit PaaC
MSDSDLNKALFEYCLRIGDTSLILSHRLSEWCGHAPILEEDIALTNIALDCIGQTKIILAYAGEVEGKGRSADDLAYHRDARQFRNLLMAEQPNGDFGFTIARQFLISAYQFLLYDKLRSSADENIAAFGEKSFKEVAYHLRHSGDWVVRLGDGTDESHDRVQTAVDQLWFYVDDIFDADHIDEIIRDNKIGPDMNELRTEWTDLVKLKFKEAGLKIPEVNNFMRLGSRQGNHTEHLGFILAEMQFLPRAYPDATW